MVHWYYYYYIHLFNSATSSWNGVTHRRNRCGVSCYSRLFLLYIFLYYNIPSCIGHLKAWHIDLVGEQTFRLKRIRRVRGEGSSSHKKTTSRRKGNNKSNEFYSKSSESDYGNNDGERRSTSLSSDSTSSAMSLGPTNKNPPFSLLSIESLLADNRNKTSSSENVSFPILLYHINISIVWFFSSITCFLLPKTQRRILIRLKKNHLPCYRQTTHASSHNRNLVNRSIGAKKIWMPPRPWPQIFNHRLHSCPPLIRRSPSLIKVNNWLHNWSYWPKRRCFSRQ